MGYTSRLRMKCTLLPFQMSIGPAIQMIDGQFQPILCFLKIPWFPKHLGSKRWWFNQAPKHNTRPCACWYKLSWIQSIWKKLGYYWTHLPIIWCDNHSTLALDVNLVLHSRSKHVEIDFCFVRDKVLAKKLGAHKWTIGSWFNQKFIRNKIWWYEQQTHCARSSVSFERGVITS